MSTHSVRALSSVHLSARDFLGLGKARISYFRIFPQLPDKRQKIWETNRDDRDKNTQTVDHGFTAVDVAKIARLAHFL